MADLAARHPTSPGRVSLSLDGEIAWLSLEHPAAHNAVSVAMMRDLVRATLELRLREPAAVIVTGGEGRAFCSGGYLREVETTLVHPDAARLMCAAMTTTLDAWTELSGLVIAAVGGPAIGGGVELALAADLRLISAAAWMELRQARLGVVAGWGGARRLVRRLGGPRALAVLALSERLDARRCVDVGLADQQVEGAAEQAALELAQRLVRHHVARALKAQVDAAERGDRAEEADVFLRVWGGRAHLQALAAARRR